MEHTKRHARHRDITLSDAGKRRLMQRLAQEILETFFDVAISPKNIRRLAASLIVFERHAEQPTHPV